MKPRTILASTVVVVLFGFSLAAYDSNFSSTRGGVTYDGLGRRLYPAPPPAQLLIGTDTLWPGPTWWITDCLWFFGGLVLAARIAGTSKN